MLLGLMGLTLSFLGTFGLALSLSFSRNVYTSLYERGGSMHYLRLKKTNGTFEKTDINYEEIAITVSWILLALGFLLQILDYFYEIKIGFLA